MCVKSFRTVVGLDAGGDADVRGWCGEANKSDTLRHQRSYAFRFSFTFRMPGLEPRLISEAHCIPQGTSVGIDLNQAAVKTFAGHSQSSGPCVPNYRS